MKKIFLLLMISSFFVGCQTVKMPSRGEMYSNLYEEKPLTILVMPPINRSVKVEAKELFYSSMAAPISQFGYYVFPPLLTMEILKEESAYDSEMFLESSMKRVGDLFGADAVLFTIIHDWRKTAIAAQMSVKVEYVLKSTKSDEILYNRVGDVTISLVDNTYGNGFASLLATVVNTAFSKEIIGGRVCNYYTLSDLPRGSYHPSFEMDKEIMAQPKEFKRTINLQQASAAASASANAVR